MTEKQEERLIEALELIAIALANRALYPDGVGFHDSKMTPTYLGIKYAMFAEKEGVSV